MSIKLDLISAPTSMQPGGYIPTAYADRVTPATKTAELEAIKQGQGWQIILRWLAKDPEQSKRQVDELHFFPDAAALVVPLAEDVPWITMGAPGKGIEGVVWKASKNTLSKMHAEGLGSATRLDADESWQVKANWAGGYWTLRFSLGAWPVLDQQKKLAVAIWQSRESERGGLKSISQGWFSI